MKDIIQKFLSGQKILLESPEPIPWELLKGHPLVVAYFSHRQRDELLEETKAHGLRPCVLKEPHLYLSPEKLAARLSADKISAAETPFLLKMALWSAETETGDREEISLEREEYGLFDSVSDEEGRGEFWEKAAAAAAASDVILIPQYMLARGFEKMPELLRGPGGDAETEFGNMAEPKGAAKRSLVILEAARLEDSFTAALRKKFTEERLRPFFGERATLLFGFLGIFFEKFSPLEAGGFRGNAVLDSDLCQSLEWKRFVSAAENLPDNPKKNELLECLTPRENWVSWVSSYADEIAFHCAPISIARQFHQNTEIFRNILLQSVALSGDGSFGLVRKLWGVDSNWTESRASDAGTRLNIVIPENFPEPFSAGYFKRCQKLFLELIEKEKGGCLFLVSSKKAAAALYQSMLPHISERTQLLAVGPTGGVGKSIALFLENPENSALLITDQVLPHLPEIENFIKVIVFQKIPFDPPGDPLLSARGKQFEDSFNGYTLQRAIMRFREVLAELGKSGSRAGVAPLQKTCYILDSRLKTRAYGNFFFG